MAGAARSAPWRVLALWPLALAAACSVYDDTLINGVTVPLGGGSGTNGAAGGSGASAGKSSTMGGAGGTTAGADSAGKGGDAVTAGAGGNAGSAGTDGGGGGSAGAAGSAGSGTGGDPMMVDLAHLDDMEDGDAAIDALDGRNGYWYVGGDATKGATLEPPSAKFVMTDTQGDRSDYAASVKATGFTDWGSVMGFNFVEIARVVNPYDASKFCGVRFWGKAAADKTAVIFRVPDGDTHPNGKVCKEGGTNNDACYDHFVQKTPFTAAWQQFSVKFSSLTQLGTGYHPADGKLKTDKLYSLEWALPNGVKTYQIWIDDVAFLTTCE